MVIFYLSTAIIVLATNVQIVNGWNPQSCPSRCKCDLMERILDYTKQEYSSAWMKTMDCTAVGLKEVPTNIPKDVQTVLFGENRLNDFDILIRAAHELTDLRQIDISRNEISNFKSNFDCKNVDSLEMSNNNLSILTTQFFKIFPSLGQLTIRRSSIAKIEGGICTPGIVDLHSLEISYNSIDNLKWMINCTTLRQMKYLDISGNKLRSNKITAYSFQSLKSLKVLKLEDMHVKYIKRNALSGLTMLEELSLDNNWLTAVPSSEIATLNNLKTLSLSGNYITRIEPNAFVNLPHVKLIELTGLPSLQIVDRKSFQNLTSLEELLLFDNPQMSYVDGDAFIGCAKLTLLDMHKSKIETILLQTIASLPSLQNLNLEKNPINCNGLMKWAKAWTTNYAKKEEELEQKNIVCAKPADVSGRSLNIVNTTRAACCVPTIQPTFPLHITILPKTNLQLNCRAFGYPKPQIVWFLAKGEALDNETYTITENAFLDQLGTLTLLNPEPGYYTCLAKNKQGMKIRTIYVKFAVVTEKKLETTVAANPELTSTVETMQTERQPFLKIHDNGSTKKWNRITHNQSLLKSITSENNTRPSMILSAPYIQLIAITSTSALITWTNTNFPNMFQLSHQQTRITLKSNGKMIYEQVKKQLWRKENMDLITTKHNLSSLTPGQDYTVCVAVECCHPEQKESTCRDIHTLPQDHKKVHSTAATISIVFGFASTFVLAFMLYKRKQLLKQNKHLYQKIDQDNHIEDLQQPLLKDVRKTGSQRVIGTTITTSFI